MVKEKLPVLLLMKCKRCGYLVEKTVTLSEAELSEKLSSKMWVTGGKPNVYETEGLCKVCRTVYGESYLKRARRS